ncbi:MBL fold metallo-hydrolase [Domibacillus epiphyticus]|uniref:MBL fold metallo-hydrolase n=1 Tax=Domibacillus epiphyticus TaxID=1714355 RepID=A0A1V2A7J8_9BACI|nr:MBL fold metallo-hydrolase [Domibacillus epiphyticus]OMP66969.1 MBL fold metallo-hydrolase [Domibacillus epiphyticus]
MGAVSLGYDIFLVDLHDSGFSKRTGSYIFHESKKAIIETSASPSIPYLLKGLKELEIDPDEIEYIIVTHIHLDHSGGAGLFLTYCPNAKIIVHPKGARHLSDPTRLIASAKTVYGENFTELFDPILPVPADRIIEMEDGGTIDLGGRILSFIHTPGHANHHFSIYDEKSNGIFTGDTAGIRYAQLADEGEAFYLPTTSPNQFNPDEMKKSIKTMMSYHPDRIYFGHYGMSDEPEEAMAMVLEWLDFFMDTAENTESVEELSETLLEKIKQFLTKKEIPLHHPVYDILKVDMDICSQGIMLYLKK